MVDKNKRYLLLMKIIKYFKIITKVSEGNNAIAGNNTRFSEQVENGPWNATIVYLI